MARKKIFQICPNCGGEGTLTERIYSISGDGTYTEKTATCEVCGGEKKVEWGFVQDSE